ncbi:protease inhibitor I9 family protein [Streptomyces sp. NBC_01565]|uniref:protease inhibitor I9 family protein n=1 Tax=unclassified Streptomyces TaxID=2593676 RepID=UPI00224F0E59|nr:protease inhibitor I9 family protein [Streptomyces sp. NBC_01565]MCX4546266.1 protease inhibitor I9 family protein [Streptomyces sp. NBC_01565]
MRTRLSRALPVAAVALAAFSALPVSAAGAAVPEPAPHAAPVHHPTYIVTVRRDLDPAGVAQLVGVTPVHVFHSTLHGFAAPLSPAQVAALRSLPGVEAVEEDGTASAGAS